MNAEDSRPGEESTRRREGLVKRQGRAILAPGRRTDCARTNIIFVTSRTDRRELDNVQAPIRRYIYEENTDFRTTSTALGGRSTGYSKRANGAHILQRSNDRAGNTYPAFKQDDVNLTPGRRHATARTRLPVTLTAHSRAPSRTTLPESTPTSRDGETCPVSARVRAANGILDPNGLPGGCTATGPPLLTEPYQPTVAHRTVSHGHDAIGLTMGYYDTQALPNLPVPAPKGIRLCRSPRLSKRSAAHT